MEEGFRGARGREMEMLEGGIEGAWRGIEGA